MTDDSGWWWPALLGAAATVAAVPIIIAVASSHSPSPILSGSRTTSTGTNEEVKEVLRKIDPLDSLYFDVSVARHMLEEGKGPDALKWLDTNHALEELRKSCQERLLTNVEGEEINIIIDTIVKNINAGDLFVAHSFIVPLQEKLAEKAYTAFRDLDPVSDGYIDGRYEAIREKKAAEWRAKGYSEGLIEKAFKWGDEWARGVARRYIKDPIIRAQIEESLYPESLALSERWIEAMAK
jgi:hypothetical protein